MLYEIEVMCYRLSLIVSQRTHRIQRAFNLFNFYVSLQHSKSELFKNDHSVKLISRS